MAYESYPYRLELTHCDGGLNNTDLPQRVAINQSPDLLNARPLAADKWGQRNGLELLANRLSSAGSIPSLWNIPKNGYEVLVRSRAGILEYINTLAGILTVISYTTNPLNGDTLILTINGTAITLTLVNAIGATPGNVLIGVDAPTTVANIRALLQNPGTTNATQVALSAPNQALVANLIWSGSTLVIKGSGTAGLSTLTVVASSSGSTSTVTNNAASWAAVPAATGFTNDVYGHANDNSFTYFGNGIESLCKWDATNNSIITFGGTTRGNILAFYLTRLIVAGDPNNPANLYYSKTGIPTDFGFSNPRVPNDGGTLTIGDGGDAITSVKSLVAVNGKSSLVVFKKSTKIYGVTFATDGTPDITELKSGTGAINHRNTVIFENDILYIDEDNNIQNVGVKPTVYNTLQKTQASNDLDDGIKDMDFTSGCGFYHKKQKFLIQVGKSFGSQINDTAFVFYTKFRSWWLWNGINASEFATYQGKLVWAASTDPNVYRLGDRYDDLPDPTQKGNPINCYRDTKDIDLSEFMMRGMSGFRKLRIPGVSTRYKQTRYVYIEGFCSPNSILNFGVFYNSDINTMVTKTMNGNGKQTDKAVDVTFGEKVFGFDAFGGFSQNPTKFPLRHFIVRISVDLYSALRVRVRTGQNLGGAPFYIMNVTPWMKLQPDGYFEDSRNL